MPPEVFVAKEELERMYLVEKMSTNEIAAILGFPFGSTIVRKLKKYGIALRSNSEASSLRNLKVTDVTRAKRSAAMKARVSNRKGAKLTDEQRQAMLDLWADPVYWEKMSAARRGAKSYRWRGGVVDPRISGGAWRRRRLAVYERDNWHCQDCGVKCTPGAERSRHGKTTIQCHHIIGRRDGGGDESENLITLCMSCHQKREHRADNALFA